MTHDLHQSLELSLNPTVLGDYLLFDRIDIGGCAEVWRAKRCAPRTAERLVAVKRLLPTAAENEELVATFVEEAKIARLLTHPNIARFESYDRIGSRHFIAMELISGKTFRTVLEALRTRDDAARLACGCFVIAAACDGLDYLHRARTLEGAPLNLVHRDLSPRNILISYGGDVKLIDFGIAHRADAVAPSRGRAAPTVYVSPEEVAGHPIDARADIFALGACLREFVAGTTRFVSKVSDSRGRGGTDSGKGLRGVDDLDSIVDTALAPAVERRYQSASEMAAALRLFASRWDYEYSTAALSEFMRTTFARDYAIELHRLELCASAKAPQRNP